MTSPTTADVVRAYLAALNSHDRDAIAALVTDDFFNHHLSSRGESLRGREAYRERLAGFLARFHDLRYEIEDLVAEDDRAMVAYRMSALRVPDGGDGAALPIDVPGVFRFVVRDGLIAYRADYRDGVTVERQLGLR